MSRSSRRGFSFLEVLACVLVVNLGLAAGIGMVMYGLRLAKVSIGRSTGMPTAISVAMDPNLITQPGWPAPTASGNISGYLNGYYVVRTETPDASNPLPSGFAYPVTVKVDVFEILGGSQVATYSQRMLRQPPP